MATQTTKSQHGKRYAEAAQQVDRARAYSPEEAVELLKQTAKAKFDETVELHIATTADPRQADQLVRGVVMLPHGTGKTRRVVAFVQGPSVAVAREAGADYIGDEELIRRIEEEGWVDFEVSVATPEMMGRIGRLGRVLGRRGLMPNPRAGTVVQAQDVGRAIREAKGGRIEFRMDRTANIHTIIGKASFTPQALLENLAMMLDAVTRARPEGIKGLLYKSIFLTTTMGPGIKLDLAKAQDLRPQ